MFTVPGDITRCVLGSRLPNIRVLRPRKPPEKLLLAFRVGIRQVGPEEDVHSTRRYHQVRPRLSPTQYSCSPTSKTPEKLLLGFRMGIRQVGPEEDVHSTRRYHQKTFFPGTARIWLTASYIAAADPSVKLCDGLGNEFLNKASVSVSERTMYRRAQELAAQYNYNIEIIELALTIAKKKNGIDSRAVVTLNADAAAQSRTHSLNHTETRLHTQERQSTREILTGVECRQWPLVTIAAGLTLSLAWAAAGTHSSRSRNYQTIT
ncbi:unnamed protein product [Trichogramma brassicae]|uniref:Uncharacterized protein n=1 Tax=Trichogramma brassicae TaxID=86971 RepID=A0A6H5J1J0_9HYME|nr:unnamed protein product [Trichogramma brassicae]